MSINGVMVDMNDEKLVRLVWNRNEEAFGVLVLRHQDGLYRYALVLLRNPADAEDCSQETLYRAYKAMIEKQTPNDPSKFQAYIRSIAYNVAMDKHRDRKKAKELYDRMNLQRDWESEHNYDNGLLIKISEAADKLPKKERIVIKLYYFEGYIEKEIAEILGCGQSAVNKRKKDGEKHLRKIIERTWGGDLR